MNVSTNYLSIEEQKAYDRRGEPPLACVAIQINKAIHDELKLKNYLMSRAHTGRTISWMATRTLAKTIGSRPVTS